MRNLFCQVSPIRGQTSGVLFWRGGLQIGANNLVWPVFQILLPFTGGQVAGQGSAGAGTQVGGLPEPDPGGSIHAARNHLPAIRAEGNRFHQVAMRHARDFPARQRIPNMGRHIVARGNRVPIRAESHPVDVAIVGQAEDFFPVRNGPHLDHLAAARNDAPPLRAESDRVHEKIVPDLGEFFAALRVPQGRGLDRKSVV